MPDIARLPILSSVTPSVSTATAAAAPSNIAGNANAGTAGTATPTGSGSDANQPADQGGGSFASILKRQIDQPAASAAAAQQPAIPAVDASLDFVLTTSLAAATTLNAVQVPALVAEPAAPQAPLASQDASQPLIALLATDPSNKSKTKANANADLTTVAADASAADLAAEQSASAAALATEAAPKPRQTADLHATQPASALFSLKSGSEQTEKTNALPDRTTDREDGQTQPSAESSIAALLALLPPPAIATAKTSATTTTDAGDTADSRDLGMAASLQPQSGQSKDGATKLLQDNQAEMPQAAPGKAADFAATQAASADAAAAQAKIKESPRADISFDNMLAAAHAQQIANHGHDRDIRTPVQANDPIKMQTPVGASGWDNEVGEKLVWMVGRQEQRAELVLNPPQLGRVEISLTMNGDQTSASFVSANPAVRDALEAALPRLREMLADAGLSLGQAQVGADSGNNPANHSAGNRGNGDNSSRFSGGKDAAIDGNMLRLTGTNQWSRQGRGLVDVFA